VTLFGRDPAAAAEEWRDVAEKYQSVLHDDEDIFSLLTGENRAFTVIQNYSKDFVDDPVPDAPKLRYLPTQPYFRSPF
jgi:hypothetical protein